MELLSPAFGLLFWTLLAFLIVFFILKKFAWVPILKVLEEREKSIADAISSAERTKMEMAAIQEENESLLHNAREERSRIIKEANEHADLMIEHAKEKAKSEYERIVSEAQDAIIQQKNVAIAEVKNQVGSLVIEISEKILRRELSNKPEQHQYIEQLNNLVKLN